MHVASTIATYNNETAVPLQRGQKVQLLFNLVYTPGLPGHSILRDLRNFFHSILRKCNYI